MVGLVLNFAALTNKKKMAKATVEVKNLVINNCISLIPALPSTANLAFPRQQIYHILLLPLLFIEATKLSREVNYSNLDSNIKLGANWSWSDRFRVLIDKAHDQQSLNGSIEYIRTQTNENMSNKTFSSTFGKHNH